jgi:hypothetical protein
MDSRIRSRNKATVKIRLFAAGCPHFVEISYCLYQRNNHIKSWQYITSTIKQSIFYGNHVNNEIFMQFGMEVPWWNMTLVQVGKAYGQLK